MLEILGIIFLIFIAIALLPLFLVAVGWFLHLVLIVAFITVMTVLFLHWVSENSHE